MIDRVILAVTLTFSVSSSIFQYLIISDVINALKRFESRVEDLEGPRLTAKIAGIGKETLSIKYETQELKKEIARVNSLLAETIAARYMQTVPAKSSGQKR